MAEDDGTRYVCTVCPNDPFVPCCHLRADKPKVDIYDCLCREYGVLLRWAPSEAARG